MKANDLAQTHAQLQADAAAISNLLRRNLDEEAMLQCGQLLEYLTGILPQLSPPLQSMVLAWAQAVLAAQERYDWVALVDELQFELPALLAALTTELSKN
ncbi:MAG: hypothetical protein ACRCYV_11000 [Aeromonas sp.]